MLHSHQLVSRSQIAQGVAHLGIESGDTVMLHAAVGSIGWVAGGPEEVLGAVTDVVGPRGTLMMYIGWEGSPYDITVEAETLPAAFLDMWPAFDPQTSRAMHSWSILTEYLRTSPQAQRSNHPDSSFAAIGENAVEITRNHSLQYGMGESSPLATLCRLKGKVLVLGAPLSRVTLLHHAEHLANVTCKHVVRYKMPVLEQGAKTWIEVEEFSTTGCLPWHGPGDLFEVILREYIQAGNGQVGVVGSAASYVFDAAHLVDFAVDWIETEFRNPLQRDVAFAIRPAQASDHRAIADMMRSLKQETLGQPMSESQASRTADEWLESDSSCVFIAETSQDIVGMIVAAVQSRQRGFLDHAFVAVEYRQNGVLREMEMDASAYLREKGCTEVEVHVDAQNTIARMAWQSLGYVSTSQSMERPL